MRTSAGAKYAGGLNSTRGDALALTVGLAGRPERAAGGATGRDTFMP